MKTCIVLFAVLILSSLTGCATQQGFASIEVAGKTCHVAIIEKMVGSVPDHCKQGTPAADMADAGKDSANHMFHYMRGMTQLDKSAPVAGGAIKLFVIEDSFDAAPIVDHMYIVPAGVCLGDSVPMYDNRIYNHGTGTLSPSQHNVGTHKAGTVSLNDGTPQARAIGFACAELSL